MQGAVGSAAEPPAILEGRLIDRLRAAHCELDGESSFIVRPDVFAIPFLDGYLLYSPLQGLVLLITHAGLASLLLNEEQSISQCLTNHELDGQADIVAEFDTRARQTPQLEPPEQFRPSSVTLSPTSACQLACTYCYIRGGDAPRDMPWEIAEAAVRFAVGNAARDKAEAFELDFHGQGEPTANWPLLRDAVLLAEDLCDAQGVEAARFSVVTNGLLTMEKAAFLAQHRFRVGLSFDGLESTMLLQRPMRGRGSSFDRVLQTIEAFEQLHVDYAIRSTVTTNNVDELPAFVDFLAQKTACKYIDFEPVSGVGRAADHGIDSATIIPRFIEKFREAWARGAPRGIKVAFSSCRTGSIRSSFCGAYGPNLNFTVSTDGLVSSCYEVLDGTDPRADLFIYGRYDAVSRAFQFDRGRLKRLHSLNVTSIGRCSRCFARWHCAGDCLAKAAFRGFQGLTARDPLERCQSTRALTKDDLIRVAVGG